MKKVYFSLVFVSATILVQAQPVLNDADFNPIIGQQVNEYNFDTSGFDPGPGGPAMTWNFSMLGGDSGHDVNVYSTFSTPHAPVFSSSNVAVSSAPLDYDYYLAHAAGLDYYGNGNSTETIPYSDPVKLFVYPFSYLSLTDDSLHASYSHEGIPVERKGRVATKGDAYGTLTIPTGTFTEVLRVKSVWTYQDMLNGAPDSVNYYSETRYYWIKPGIHFPLLTYIKIKSIKSGVTSENISGYYIDPSSITATADNNETVPGFLLYPNPVREPVASIWFRSESTQDIQLVLMSTSGEKVFSNTYYLSEGNNQLTVPVGQLQPGIYFVEMVTENGRAVRKLVVG